MPSDTNKNFYYCCPSGWRSIGRKKVQVIGTGWKNIETNRMTCPEDRKVLACGPKPEGEVKCCPQTHEWLPDKGRDTCPVGSMASGVDVGFMQRLGVRGKQQDNLGLKLLLIGLVFSTLVGAGVFLLTRS
jgi:hypothetical protein